MTWLMQTYFFTRISFTEVAEHIMEVVYNVKWEVGDYVFHMPYKHYDGVFYIGSMMNQDVARYYRYMWWTDTHVYYGVTEGPPILSPFNIAALQRMKVIVPSRYVAWELERAGIKCDITLVPHGVRVEKIRNTPRNNMWRKIFGDKLVCLYVAHRHIRKGFKELVEAWKRSKAGRDPNVLLVLHTSRKPNKVSGEDFIIPEEGNIVVTDNILQLNHEDLYGLYRAADIYIHGALAEGFGIPIIEAIAAGLPTLTLDAPPMSELNRIPEARVKVASQEIKVDRGIVTYRLNYPDITDYAEKIDQMVYDRWYRQDIMERQQEYITEYNYKMVYRRLMEIIK